MGAVGGEHRTGSPLCLRVSVANSSGHIVESFTMPVVMKLGPLALIAFLLAAARQAEEEKHYLVTVTIGIN